MTFLGRLQFKDPAADRWLRIGEDRAFTLSGSTAPTDQHTFLAESWTEDTFVLRDLLAGFVWISALNNEFGPYLDGAFDSRYPVPFKANWLGTTEAVFQFPCEDNGADAFLTASQGSSGLGVTNRVAWATRFQVRVVTPGLAEILSSKDGADCNFSRLGRASVSLRGVSFQGVDFRGATFDGADLEGASFAGCSLGKSSFSAAGLAGASFAGSFLGPTALDHCDLTAGVVLPSPWFSSEKPGGMLDLSNSWVPAPLLHDNWSSVDLTGASLMDLPKQISGLTAREGRFPALNLKDADISASEFSGSDLTGSTFRGSTLKSVTFEACNLSEVVFSQCKISDSSFSSTESGRTCVDKADFSGCELLSTSLRGVVGGAADFRGARFYSVDLSDADLSPADAAANFELAYFDSVTWTDAVLRACSFRYATFATPANFVATSLERSDFTGSFLTRAKFDQVKLHRSRFDAACMLTVSLRGAILGGSADDAASMVGAALYGAVLDDAELDFVDMTGSGLSTRPLAILFRQCSSDGTGPVPKEPDWSRVDCSPVQGFDRNALGSHTICPNGETVQENLADGLTYSEMMQSGSAPTSWRPVLCFG